ncbi:PAS/PAC sensor hybrid histidine kinase [Rhodopseudomonas palustris BisB5]|uniref:histidine kinase n=2 Tax=Rhodopseudomonas TaxID=1073 RepID=Q134I8_RHOPS|nr:PAS/PAC sensor hybrid histidine kinase [Rhodopseudomonas palustris BisB5]
MRRPGRTWDGATWHRSRLRCYVAPPKPIAGHVARSAVPIVSSTVRIAGGGLAQKRIAMISENPEASILRALIKAAPDGVLLVDPQQRIVLFNQACEDLFGWTAREALGEEIAKLIPDWRELSRSTHRSSALARRKDGASFTIALSTAPVPTGDADFHVVLARKRDEDVLPRADRNVDEHSFRRLVEGVTDYAIFMLDIHGCVSSWNRGAERIKQYTAAEILGRHFSEFYPEEQRASGEPARNLDLARDNGRFETTGWRQRKDGSQFWAHVVLEPLRDENGALIGYAKVATDITEQRRAEQVIREADARIHTLIETVVDGVILSDRLGRIRTFNLACHRLFGYEAEDVIGRHISMLLPATSADEVHSFFRHGAYAGEHDRIGSVREMTGLRRDGRTFPMDLSIGETMQDGESVFVVVVHDLTDRKRTEEQLVQAQKMETVGQLSGGIAHDFNNLLTVIVGNAEFLGDQLKARQDLRSLARDISRAGQRGAELTQRLLAFSRRQTLKPVELDCNELVDSMHKLLRPTLREDIVIDTDLDPGLRTAYADRSQLESAILNLALNAQDAMLGGGRLSITTSNVSLDASYQVVNQDVRPGDYVLVSVTDNGSGMPREVLEHVFEPFYTTKEVGKGSGLGLSMVYGFVKQSNGHVSVYSEPGLGTTVRLYLPAIATGQPASAETADVTEHLPSRGEVVLIVEDDPFVRSYAVMCLRSLGYIVIAAIDGADALQTLDGDGHIDVLFTDIVMPGGISGWELAETAMLKRPGLHVLLTSGYALDTIAGRSRGGGLPVLNKPYRKADLARRLREVIDTPRSQR